MEFDETHLADDVLAALAADHGAAATCEPHTTAWATHWLKVGGHPLLAVREPPEGWPVTVCHYHGDPSHRTDYVYCDADHNPNRHRVGPEDKRAAAAAENPLEALATHDAEHKAQQAHTPIDTPQKLYDLCRALLAGETPASAGHTAAVKARAQRHARRAAAIKPA